MTQRRIFTKEFKQSAVELYHSSGRSAKDVAKDLGINPGSLLRWVRESKEGETSNKRVFPGNGNARDEEVARLKKEIAELKEANEILKKAMAFFVVKTPL